MRNLLLIVMVLITFNTFNEVNAAIFEGTVSKQGQNALNHVVDAQTGEAISGAMITLPQKGYSTYSGGNGEFALRADINAPTVLSIQKDGYKPFTLTLNKDALSSPITLSIERSNPLSIILDTEMFHLGDSRFSSTSANASDFKVQPIGPIYKKIFPISNALRGQNVYLKLGSVIGLDTALAKRSGQNRIIDAYSSPAEVYFNGNKIAELHVNGDSQFIRIPSNLIRFNSNNEIVIKTGRNLMQLAYIDYDDIEIMNISIESR